VGFPKSSYFVSNLAGCIVLDIVTIFSYTNTIYEYVAISAHIDHRYLVLSINQILDFQYLNDFVANTRKYVHPSYLFQITGLSVLP
jgi:hypothetical protein